MQPQLEHCSIIVPHTVTWGEMDAFNHVNNTQYFRYFENIRIAHFEQAGFMKIMSSDNKGPILAETNCRFKAPLTYPDTLTIGLNIKAIDKDSFTQAYTVFSEKLNRVVAEGEGKIVYYDYTNNCRCDMTEVLLEALRG